MCHNGSRMEYSTRPGYMTVREAAAQYQVSRAKLHRLIRLGQLQIEKDPRDERATLLRTGELETLFRFPREKKMERYSAASTEVGADVHRAGVLTAAWRARIDALRSSASGGRRFADDSVDILREVRARSDEGLLGSDAETGDKPGSPPP